MNLRSYLFSIKQYLLNRDACVQLKKYRNIHKGERCFIIGTGPSLTVDDLELLKDEYTFASNRIFEIYPRTQWRPTYYMNQDFKLIEKFADEICALDARAIFLPVDVRADYMPQPIRDQLATIPQLQLFVLRAKEFYPGDADFSEKLHHYMGQGFTVTYGAIQMARYMGFSEVYLLGIDHNYSISQDEHGNLVVNQGVKDYFQGSTASNTGINLPRVVETTRAYMTARKYADRQKDFTVYNATRGGKLEAFPRVKLEDVLGKKER